MCDFRFRRVPFLLTDLSLSIIDIYIELSSVKPIVKSIQLLGINIFTYVLAALIALFLSLNLILDPGWLGQQIGFAGTGIFTQTSDSLPDSVDLSGVAAGEDEDEGEDMIDCLHSSCYLLLLTANLL